eukprot:PITA_24809
MLESKAVIIPVFYGVKPDTLRWTQGKGDYADALRVLEKKRKRDQVTPRHDSTTIESWREALSNVAGISGFELEACNGDQRELLEKVVESVLRKVKKPPLNVAKYPTGLDKMVIDFENEVLSLHQQSGRKPQVAGIVGLGGVGKTTLAKELYNGKRSHYKKYFFLADVRENAGKGSLTTLQSTLLKSLIGSSLPIDNKDEGIEMLKKHLSSDPILLVLDDVDTVDQVDELVPDRTCIHSDSLILITSRDKDVLTRSGVENSLIYKLNGLNKEHSLELFCQHAFGRPDPLSNFENLAEEFVNACHGLPLSLKVVGALLHGNNDTFYWHKQLDKLKKILPRDIQERLRISYDALDAEEKNMFLDIACFFVGEERDTAIRIWNGSGWDGYLGLRNLQNRCLVEVVEEKCWVDNSPHIPVPYTINRTNIHMHDYLRHLGRQIACSMSPCRLWPWDESGFDNLLQQSSEITVRGIQMVLRNYLDDNDFEGIQMKRLQLVDTQGTLLERIWKRVKSADLIWLRWENCPHSSLPPWIPMKNLRVLKVSGDTIETLWQQESQASLHLPVRLEELRVDKCKRLKSIEGLAQLTKLQRLDANWCDELVELPSMETLVCLEELRVRGCVQLRIIRGLEQARKLRRLNVGRCYRLEDLPSMETLVCLEVLQLERCKKVKSIRGLEQAAKLRRLDVRGCRGLDELPSMETLVSLEDLRAAACPKVKSILGLEHATKLWRLDVRECIELEELPPMETLVSLEVLWAEACPKLKSIRGLRNATNLRELKLSGCSELDELPSMEKLLSLEGLWADGCTKLKSIRGLENATNLRWLDVSRCSELDELPRMETLVSLEGLWAEGCSKLKKIQGFKQETNLRWLHVSGCSELHELPIMDRCVSLEELCADGCAKLKSIRGLEQATNLRGLNVSGCYEIEELPTMETLLSLEELRADGCIKLKSIRGLLQCTQLRTLSVRGCCELVEVESIEHCTWLEKFADYGCNKLQCPVWE